MPFGTVALGIPGTVGAVASMNTGLEDAYGELFPAMSLALTRKYHVPSASEVVCVKEFVLEKAVLASQPVKPASVHHCAAYAGLASPEPESVEASHDHVGLLLLVGEVVDGVPGVDGGVVSMVYVNTAFPSPPLPPAKFCGSEPVPCVAPPPPPPGWLPGLPFPFGYTLEPFPPAPPPEEPPVPP